MSGDNNKMPLWKRVGWEQHKSTVYTKVLETAYAKRVSDGFLVAVKQVMLTDKLPKYLRTDAPRSKTWGYWIALFDDDPRFKDKSDFWSFVEHAAPISAGVPGISIDWASSPQGGYEDIDWSPNAGKLLPYRPLIYNLPREFVKALKPVLEHPERLEFRKESIDETIRLVDDQLRQTGIDPNQQTPIDLP